ncbi:MAG: Phosphoribosylglycinamide formyltransferase [Firmicutes bacterium]|nr:Phosphoribosylglycinamide formyltransferase [Bacillota bacterium]MBT9152865.1 Phosphoribosylglycinamide formyltransferase [Bacillota bacterium]MBT9157390.1 Phosphoribosylglycinamide formyltransferase [Bacillota bacterium]
MLGRETVSAFAGRIMNIHPSLLPAFGGRGMYGLKVHSAVLAYGCRVSGATVFFVDEGADSGPIIMQAAVPVLAADTPGSLAARVAQVEKTLYPQAIKLFGEGRLGLEGRRVIISEVQDR